MSERGKRSRRSNKTVAYIAAALVHIVIIGALFVNFTKKTETLEAAYAEKVDVVKATTVDQTELQKQQDLLKQQDREKQRQKELEEQKLKDLQQQAQKEKDRVEDLKKQQELEKEKATKLEEERKALALKRKEEEERQKELEERLKKEAAEEERKKLAAEEKKRKEEAEMQRQLQESLAAEEAFLAEQVSKERTTTLLSKYGFLIQEKVTRYRTISPDFESWRVAKLSIKLSSLGEVESVRVLESSGSIQYDRSVESAVLQASPLPIPDPVTETSAHNEMVGKGIILNFDMKSTR